MAEEPNQELSMDDILSSIRSILMEDNAAQQTGVQPTQPKEEAVKEDALTSKEETEEILSALPSLEIPENNEEEISVDDLLDAEDELKTLDAEDEVFNLSPSMIREEPEEAVATENKETFAEPEISEDDILNLSNLASSIQENTQEQNASEIKITPDLHAPLASEVLSVEDSGAEDSFSLDEELSSNSEISFDNIDIPTNEPKENEVPQNFEIKDQVTFDAELEAQEEKQEEKKKEEIKAALPPLDFDLPKVDVDAEPIFEPEGQTVTDVDVTQLKESISGSVDEEELITSEQESQPEPQAIEDNLPNDVLGASPTSEFEETAVINETEESQDLSDVSQQTQVNEASQDAADVSANIINNFAKLFAEKKNAQAEGISEPETTAPQTASVKNSSQSIAELVREAVVKQVTQQMDVNFETYAKEAVAAQTQAWLDANLPAIVEAVVAKEIERVMAKVGS